MSPGYKPESTEENTGNIVPEKNTGIRINEKTSRLEIRGSYGDWYEVDPTTGSPLQNTIRGVKIKPCYNID